MTPADDACPSCGKAGYREVRARKDAERERWQREWARRFFVYRVYDEDGLLLYIGCTGSPRERWLSHRRESGWANYADHFHLSGPYHRDKALLIEKTAIRSEHPLWNVQGRKNSSPEIEQYLAARTTA